MAAQADLAGQLRGGLSRGGAADGAHGNQREDEKRGWSQAMDKPRYE